MLEKLKSRKLWVALIGVAVGVLMILGVDSNEIVTVAGGIVSVLSALGYQFAESKVDAARGSGTETISTTNNYNGTTPAKVFGFTDDDKGENEDGN